MATKKSMWVLFGIYVISAKGRRERNSMGASVLKFTVASAVATLLWVIPFGAFCAAAESYYPLKAGMTWQYQSSSGGSWVVKNLAPRELGGKTVTPQQVGNDLWFLVEDSTGIYDFAKQSSSDIDPQILTTPYYYYVKNPASLGTNWEEKSQTTMLMQNVSFLRRCVIEKIDDVITVLAGTFKDCVRIKCTGSTQVPTQFGGVAEVRAETYNWYAPGVGRVRSITKERSNNLLIGPGGEGSSQLVSFTK